MSDTNRRPANLGFIASGIGIAIFILGFMLSKAANGTAMVPAYLSAGVLVLLGLLAATRAILARRQQVEEEAVAEYRRTHGEGTELFEDADEAVRLATRANENFLKFFVPFFTIALGCAVVIAGVLVWRSWTVTDVFPVARTPLSMAALSFLLGLVSAICGSYFVGVSREPGCRWVRPCGAWMFLSGGLFVLSGVVMLAEHFGRWVEVIDVRMGQIGLGLLIALGIEQILSFVIEFYRPRMPGEEERPLPESRILALFTEPGGVARNVASSLDYQFGFEVSEVWFYRFLEQTMVPFAVAMVAFMWLLTCLVTVGPEEQAIRERFGRVVSQTPLDPGLYVKWPWPFARINKFDVQRVQEVAIGYVPPDGGGTEEYDDTIIVWTRQHNKEETTFAVANRPAESDEGDVAPVTVSFMAASIPLYYRVENLYNYEYEHTDARETLKQIATREVVAYLASVDFSDILGDKRHRGADALARRIQQAAEATDLGIRVVFVGLQGIHPPVTTGAAFNAVVGASEEMHERILEAEAYAIGKEPEAEAARYAMLQNAEAYRTERTLVSEAEAERFDKQLMGYGYSPRLFVLDNLLDVLENEAAAIRKYVVAAEGSTEVYILDLQEKLRPDLLDIELGAGDETGE